MWLLEFRVVVGYRFLILGWLGVWFRAHCFCWWVVLVVCWFLFLGLGDWLCLIAVLLVVSRLVVLFGSLPAAGCFGLLQYGLWMVDCDEAGFCLGLCLVICWLDVLWMSWCC